MLRYASLIYCSLFLTRRTPEQQWAMLTLSLALRADNSYTRSNSLCYVSKFCTYRRCRPCSYYRRYHLCSLSLLSLMPTTRLDSKILILSGVNICTHLTA